jgi:hypothetical protein
VSRTRPPCRGPSFSFRRCSPTTRKATPRPSRKVLKEHKNTILNHTNRSNKNIKIIKADQMTSKSDEHINQLFQFNSGVISYSLKFYFALLLFILNLFKYKGKPVNVITNNVIIRFMPSILQRPFSRITVKKTGSIFGKC